MMDDRGRSHNSVVPKKSPNKGQSAEGMEGRELAKGKTLEQNMLRTQGREGVHRALERIREAAQKDKRQRFTALFHHVYSLELLRKSYFDLRRKAAPGIDGETWRHYGERLEEHLKDLSERLKRGAYRARPARRAYVPKTDGRQRPIGLLVLEDKIVQRAVVEVLNAIYEGDFLGFSYGFRPGRNAHQALDILSVGLMTRKVNWVLDADIRGFFDTLDHGWLVKLIEHRIGDRRSIRLMQKWLKAGVLEEGKWTCSGVGTVQGGSISPLLANIYLHYVFDLWVSHWRKTRAEGDVVVVRYADDCADSSIVARRRGSWLTSMNGSYALGWNSIRIRRRFWSSADLRKITGAAAKKGNRRHSTSWGSPISVEEPGRGNSSSFVRRCARGGRRSSKKYINN